jgi:hypothetical protein
MWNERKMPEQWYGLLRCGRARQSRRLVARQTKAAGSGGPPASGCLAHKGPGNRLPHHQQHCAVEAIGLCHKLFQIVVFDDVAVFDDAHPRISSRSGSRASQVSHLRHRIEPARLYIRARAPPIARKKSVYFEEERMPHDSVAIRTDCSPSQNTLFSFPPCTR